MILLFQYYIVYFYHIFLCQMRIQISYLSLISQYMGFAYKYIYISNNRLLLRSENIMHLASKNQDNVGSNTKSTQNKQNKYIPKYSETSQQNSNNTTNQLLLTSELTYSQFINKKLIQKLKIIKNNLINEVNVSSKKLSTMRTKIQKYFNRNKQNSSNSSNASNNSSNNSRKYIKSQNNKYRQKLRQKTPKNEYLNQISLNYLSTHDSKCLGCIKSFDSSKYYNFDEFQQNYLIFDQKILEDQLWNTQNICALANQGGGFIFIADYVRNQNGNYQMKGVMSEYNAQREKFRAFVEKSIKYIQPALDRSCVTIDFIPVLHSQPILTSSTKITENYKNDKNRYVIRININLNTNLIQRNTNYLYYTSYKLQSSDKRIEAQFFKLDKNNGNKKQEIILMDFEDVYYQIHRLFYKKSANFNNQIHRGIQCYNPETFQSIQKNKLLKLKQKQFKINQTKIMHHDQSVQQKQQKATDKDNSYPLNLDLRYRFHMVVVKLKGTKSDDVKIQEISTAILNQKILFQIQKMKLPKGKSNVWVISHDCNSEIIENIIKVYNKIGEFSTYRARNWLKINDEAFLSQEKDNQLFDIIYKLTQQKKSDMISAFFNNIQDRKLNEFSKKPVYIKFTNIQNSILSYGLLVNLCRRIEFVEGKF